MPTFGTNFPVMHQLVILRRGSFTKLARMGLYVEPTSAGAADALSKLRAQGIIKAEETTVVLLTGTGLKSTQAIGEFLGI